MLGGDHELVLLYWHLGRDILARQAAQSWGSKVIERLAHDLRAAFPQMKGFSRADLIYMRAFAEAWPDAAIVQQAAGQLPWGHNLILLTRLKDPQQRLAYADRPCALCVLVGRNTSVRDKTRLREENREIGILFPMRTA